MSKMASTPKTPLKLTSSTLNSHSSSHRNSITQARSLTQSFSSFSQSKVLRAAGPLTPTLVGSIRGAVVAQQAGVQALKDIAKWHSQIQVRTAGGKRPVLESGGVRKSCNSSQVQEPKRIEVKKKKGRSADFNRSQLCIGKKPDYDGNSQYKPARIPNVHAEIRIFGSQIDSLPGSVCTRQATRSREETPVAPRTKRPSSLNNEFLHSFEFRDNCCEPSSFSLLHTSLSNMKSPQKKLLLAAQRIHFHSKTPLD